MSTTALWKDFWVFFRPTHLRILPDHPRCVPEDGGGEALGDAHKTGPIHLHDLVVHLDPEGHTGEMFNNPSCECFSGRLVTCQRTVTLLRQGTKQTGSSCIPHYFPNYSGRGLSCGRRFPVVLYQTVAWWRDRGDEAQNKIGGPTRTRLSLGHNTAWIHSAVDGMIGQLSSRPGMKLLMGFFSWKENCAQILLVVYLKSAEKKQPDEGLWVLNHVSDFFPSIRNHSGLYCESPAQFDDSNRTTRFNIFEHRRFSYSHHYYFI